MDDRPRLWSLQRRPGFSRSAGVATAAYVATLLASVLISAGAAGEGTPVLSALGGVLALVGLIWGGQAIHRLASNIDVAAEAVYAEYTARSADE